MTSIEELNREIQSLAVAIDYCHRGENGYDGGQEELDTLIKEQNELIQQRDNITPKKKGLVNGIKKFFGLMRSRK